MIDHEMHGERCLRREDEEEWTGMDWCKLSELSAQAWDHRSKYG
jgi:hypothetical protein